MKYLVFSLLLLLPACTTGPLKSEKATIIKPQDHWQYPGMFKPFLGEKIAFLYLQGQNLTECKVENIDQQLLYNLNNFLKFKDNIEEEGKNFVHFKLNPGEDWLLVKSYSDDIAQKECLRLTNYLIRTFNFKINQK